MRPANRFRPHLECLEDRTVPTALPPGFTETLVANGFTAPTSTAVAPDGRLFVTEQGGTVRVVQNGQVLPTPLLSLTVDSAGERGLLGLEFDPNFAANGFIYVYYTVPGTPAHNRVSRFTVAGNSAGSESVLLELDNLADRTNHNGGALHFGGDGKLYVATGDAGFPDNSRLRTNTHGKILRINPDGSIPTDNPFLGSTTGNDRAIYSLGLRNPFTFGFNPGTNRFFINDVGGARFEEINEGIAGADYGWDETEGFEPPGVAGVTYPIYAYGKGPGNFTGNAVTGGAFGPAGTVFAGGYYFADFTNKWVNRLDLTTGQVTNLATNLDFAGTVDIDFDAAGGLLVTSRAFGSTGRVTRIAFTASGGGGGTPGTVLSGQIAVGVGPGGVGIVQVLNPLGELLQQTVPFPGFLGGVRVARGDVDGDGIADTIAAAGPGAGPHVKVISGRTGEEIASFFAYAPNVSVGVEVAAGDVNGDGRADVITALSAGASPHVRVFDVVNGRELLSFFAFDPAYLGGVSVAAGDVDGDRRADIIVGAALGVSHVRVFSGATGAELGSFFAYGAQYAGGVVVAAGDVDGDLRADILTGTGFGQSPHVKAFRATDLAEIMSFFAFDPRFLGGVRLSAVPTAAGADVVVSAASGGTQVRVFDGRTGGLRSVFSPFDPAFLGGVSVGGG